MEIAHADAHRLIVSGIRQLRHGTDVKLPALPS